MYIVVKRFLPNNTDQSRRMVVAEYDSKTKITQINCNLDIVTLGLVCKVLEAEFAEQLNDYADDVKETIKETIEGAVQGR